MHWRSTRLQIRWLDDLSGVRSLGDHQEVILLRAFVTAGLIVPGVCRAASGQAGARGKGCRKQQSTRRDCTRRDGVRFCLVVLSLRCSVRHDAITPRNSVKKRAIAAFDSNVFDVAKKTEPCAQTYSRMQFATHRYQRQPTDVPLITRVHIRLQSTLRPAPPGDPGVPPFAPALMNAISCSYRHAHPGCPVRQADGRQELSSRMAQWAVIHAADTGSAAFLCPRMTGIGTKSCEFLVFTVFARGPPVRLPIIWHKRCMVK